MTRATYTPAAFPRRPKQSTLLSELRYQLQLGYYRYEINTALYVMSPGEKMAYNIIVLSFFMLFFSAVYYCLPSAVSLSMERLAYYFTGSSKMQVTHLQDAEVLQSSREAIESLVNGRKVVNASFGFAP